MEARRPPRSGVYPTRRYAATRHMAPPSLGQRFWALLRHVLWQTTIAGDPRGKWHK